MRLPDVPRHPGDPSEHRATIRGVVTLTGCAAAVVLAAFLWPAALGGCTSLDVVPAGAAGSGLGAGDVVLTRCGAPEVGDRVVHREDGAAWTVGRVVDGGPGGWHVQDVDGAAPSRWAHPGTGPGHPHSLVVLPLQVSEPQTVLQGVGAVVTVAAAATVLRRVHRRPAEHGDGADVGRPAA